MKTLNRKFQLMACGLAAFGISSAAHAGIVIDNFEGRIDLEATTTPAASPVTGFVTVADDTDGDSLASIILGGERDLSVSTSGLNNVAMTTDAASALTQGLLTYSEDSMTDGSGTLIYDGSDAATTIDHTGLGGVDLTVGGTSTAIEVVFVTLDVPTSDITFTIYTDSSNASQLVIPLTTALTSATVSFPYASFDSTFLGTGADFTNVGAIVMDIDITSTTIRNDLDLHRIQTNMVPVPMAAWTGIPMLAGLGLLRKRMS